MNIIQSPSPNFFGRNGYNPELIVVHVTEGNYPYDMQYLQNPSPVGGAGPVSCHYLIDPSGLVHQLVSELNGAWHAGRIQDPTAKLMKKDQSGGYINPNYYTIGIEVSLTLNATILPVQYQSLKDLVTDISARNKINLDRDHIIGHHEIFFPKTCPGTISVDQLVKDIVPSAPNNIVQAKGLLVQALNLLNS
jgi:N-acetylmuramoyl-L-alanine amidase